MNPLPSSSLLAVMGQLLRKIEGTSYPIQDPISIENLKAYLRCRVVALEAEEGLGPLPPEAPERPRHSRVKNGGNLDPSDSVPFHQRARIKMKNGKFRTDKCLS